MCISVKFWVSWSVCQERVISFRFGLQNHDDQSDIENERFLIAYQETVIDMFLREQNEVTNRSVMITAILHDCKILKKYIEFLKDNVDVYIFSISKMMQRRPITLNVHQCREQISFVVRQISCPKVCVLPIHWRYMWISLTWEILNGDEICRDY